MEQLEMGGDWSWNKQRPMPVGPEDDSEDIENLDHSFVNKRAKPSPESDSEDIEQLVNSPSEN